MALRVLLADESVTIKKVIQLALQDFAVEVKAVPVGVDVLAVTKTFKPDLIFADILLQKRSGYDVCRDLKRDAETASLPVVLMWSSFMELDQAQLEATGADGKLEKPFDVETLRRLVLELVPRTRTQRMAHYLDFPATVAAPLKSEEAERAKNYHPPVPPVPVGDFEIAAPIPTAPIPTAPIPTGVTPAIPERPEAINLAPSESSRVFAPSRPSTESSRPNDDQPLGVLPDLHFSGASSWTMESFEPMANFSDIAAADDEADEFKPLQLPNVDSAFEAPASLPALSLMDDGNLADENQADKVHNVGNLDDSDDDEIEEWAPQSLDKYRIAPLTIDESLALDDDETPALPPPAAPAVHYDRAAMARSGAITDKIPAPPPPPSPAYRPQENQTEKRPGKAAPIIEREQELAEFSLDEREFARTFEIEPIADDDRTQPSIIRELLREPDFTGNRSTDHSRDREGSFAATPRQEAAYEPPDTTEITEKIPETGTFVKDVYGTVDLSLAGRPSNRERAREPRTAEPSNRMPMAEGLNKMADRKFEEIMRTKMEPELEASIERMVTHMVKQLLPQIAERIISRELQKLLEDSEK